MDANILEQLNESQREATVYCDGAQLVIAGAGSGKTRVLTYKVAYLLQQGYKPWNILALTFTNKAASEMKERIATLVGHDKARLLNMGTFHSTFAKILRTEASHIGYNSNFTIYDQNDSRSLVKSIIKEMGLDDKKYGYVSVAEKISRAKNHLLIPQAYATSEQAMIDTKTHIPAVKDIYARYVERCRKANAMDFDDLLLYTYLLFSGNEDIRLKYSDRFKYILVDEYQDTNFAQQEIVLQLSREHQPVCAVGDDAQSIYAFRGANIDNILNFTQCHANAKLFKLEQNYRSTQMIVQAANSLIRHNKRQIQKNVYSDKEQGDKLALKMAYSDREEAAIVCNEINRIRKTEGDGYGSFAILYRTNSQSRSIEEEMRKRNMPYRIYGGLSFYQRKEIKDIIAYFRLVANPDDEEAFKRIINYPARGIGDTTIGKLAGAATERGVSLWTVAGCPTAYGLSTNKGTNAKLADFCSMVMAWREKVDTCDAYVLGQAIIRESGISHDIFSGKAPEDLARQENVTEFLAGMQDFIESRREEGRDDIRLTDFLQEVALLTDMDENNGDDDDKVSLMTIHSAKGLEFPTVFIVGLEENIIPSQMCCDSPSAVEEERRLLYVAITRAEKHCILTFAQSRYRYGKIEFGSPSRFLNEIDPAFIKTDSAVENGLFGFSSGRKSAFRKSEDFPEWQQNPRPVASQFKADPKRRIVPIRREEPLASPFQTPSANRLAAKLKPLNGLGNASHLPNNNGQAPIAVGNIIEHQRFGMGTVICMEGSGENLKATVVFKNSGTKQLLLKFAKYKVVR